MPAEVQQEITANRHERRVIAAAERQGLVILVFEELKSKHGIPLSRMHVDRLEKAGQFPKRVQLGKNSVGWLESEILDWLSEKIARRGSEAA